MIEDNFNSPVDEQSGPAAALAEETQAALRLRVSQEFGGSSGPGETQLEVSVGCQVEITGLKAREDLNGKQALVLFYIVDTQRWEIELLDDDAKNEHVRCKTDNLVVTRAATPDAGSIVAAGDPEKIKILCGGDVRSVSPVVADVINVPPRPYRQNRPTAYRVLLGELFKKAAKETDRIVKFERQGGSIVRTTGELFEGPSGGRWAELDTTAGERTGWVNVEGPGLGPSSCKVKCKFLCT